MASDPEPEAQRSGSGQQVRLATPADLDRVVDCQTRCWVEAYTGLVPASYFADPTLIPRRREHWRARLAGERRVLVATDSATPALCEGVVSAGPSRDDPAPTPLELMSLYIRERWHGTGLADQLLHACIGESAASLWVFTVNARAQAFYRRHGFVADGAEALDADTGLMQVRMVR